jgi:hypothetical protein
MFNIKTLRQLRPDLLRSCDNHSRQSLSLTVLGNARDYYLTHSTFNTHLYACQKRCLDSAWVL